MRWFVVKGVLVCIILLYDIIRNNVNNELLGILIEI